MNPARPQRPCRQPHGTVARYVSGCSCLTCCDEWRRYRAAYNSGGHRLRDPLTARRHIAYLKSNSRMSYRAIAECAGLALNTVRSIADGTTKRIHPETHDALLTVRGPVPSTSGALVTARPTHGIIAALRTRFTLAEIASAVGVHPTSLPYPGQRRVMRRTHLRIADAAKRLRDQWKEATP